MCMAIHQDRQDSMESASHRASHGGAVGLVGSSGNRVKLSEAYLKKRTAPTSGEVRIYDSETPGLLLRWRAAGAPRWYLLRRVGTRTVQDRLGEINRWPDITVETARKLAVAARQDLASGITPSEKRKSAHDAKEKEKKRSVPIALAITTHLARLTTRGVGVEHHDDSKRTCEGFQKATGIDDLLDPQCAVQAEKWISGLKLSDSSKKRHRANLRSLGATALRWWPELMTRNPFAALEAGPVPLVVPEIFTVVECMLLVSERALAHQWGRCGAMLLYTGMRLQEGVHAHWSRIDLSENQRLIYVVPPTAAERAEGARVKRNRGRAVPIQPELGEILARTPEAERNGYLMPDTLRLRSRAEHRRQFLSWCKLAGVTVGDRHPHSLRHTRACMGLAAGENDLTLRLTLGHSNEAMSAWYAQSAMRMKAQVGHWNGKLILKVNES